MLEFKKLTLSDIPVIREYFLSYPSRSCDSTVGGVFIWRDYYNTRYTVYDDTLIFMVDYLHGETAFTCPTGKSFEAACKAIENYCAENKLPLIFCVVTEEQLKRLQAVFPVFSAADERDMADYIYDSAAISSLVGRKYNTQRNHINRFSRLYPNSSFEPITPENVGECIEFLKAHADKDFPAAKEELSKIIEVLESLDAYGFSGGLLRVEGQIVGFSCGEIIADTLTVHIEKANTSFEGCYPTLTNRFLKAYLTPDVRFVNREDDSGDEGLRKSKLSYRPIELLKKHTVLVELAE